MSFYHKIHDPDSRSRNTVLSPKEFPFRTLVAAFICVFFFGIGLYFQSTSNNQNASNSVVGMAKTATDRERKEFVDLLWVVKGIRLFNCDENGQNYIKELGILTEFEMSEDDLDWRGKGKTLDDALKEAFKRTKVPMEEFDVTKWAKDKYGKSRPVEWASKHNSEVNIDAPHTYDGLDVFHVGYQTEGKKNIVGHILMDCLPYFRELKKDNE